MMTCMSHTTYNVLHSTTYTENHRLLLAAMLLLFYYCYCYNSTANSGTAAGMCCATCRAPLPICRVSCVGVGGCAVNLLAAGCCAVLLVVVVAVFSSSSPNLNFSNFHKIRKSVKPINHSPEKNCALLRKEFASLFGRKSDIDPRFGHIWLNIFYDWVLEEGHSRLRVVAVLRNLKTRD